MSYKLSIVIICGSGLPERIRNCNETIRCLKNQTYQNYEIIIVEQSIDGNFYHSKTEATQYIAIKDPMDRGFNRSWCRNVGAYSANGEIILLMDADYVFPNNYLEKIICQKEDFFAGTDLYLWSTQTLAEKYIQNHDVSIFEKCKMRLRPFLGGIATGGILGFNRKWYIKEFTGYNESFFNYGFEDNEALNRIMYLLGKEYDGLATTPIHVAHLFHTVRDQEPVSNGMLFNKFKNTDIETLREMMKSQDVGNKNAPCVIEEKFV